MQSEIANMFRITGAQLSKSITGIDYESGPHHHKKRKLADTDSTTKLSSTETGPVRSQTKTASKGTRAISTPSTSTAKHSSSAPGRVKQPPTKRQKLAEPPQEEEEDTLPSESTSSDKSLPPGLFP